MTQIERLELIAPYRSAEYDKLNRERIDLDYRISVLKQKDDMIYQYLKFCKLSGGEVYSEAIENILKGYE